MSYNQPKLSPCAQWDPNGITFAESSKIIFYPVNLFVDRNNTVYVVDDYDNRVYMWREGTTTPQTIILDPFFKPASLFVTIDGDIYIASVTTLQVEKLALNETKGIVMMSTSSFCIALFVDIANYLYCSLADEHQVVKQSLNASTNMPVRVAGNGYSGSASNMLYRPHGIFVDTNFNLYVADCENSRVQLFKTEQIHGITVAGNNGTLSIELKCPSAIFLDADGYLFILDQNNDRIIGSNLDRYYCLAGCSGTHGAASDQLNFPISAAFDNHGNIFVADIINKRIQKFILMTDAFGK